MYTSQRTLLFMIFAVCLLWAPASASAEGICTSFGRAKQADIKAPEVQRALTVWRRLAAPFEAMTGRTTGVVVLASEAGFEEGDKVRPYPPTGHICPGAPPVVYVTWPLIDLLYKQSKYPESFLAFVLGHELGHRFNDLDASGSLLGADQRPGKGRSEESLADKRAAFFATLAGYPMQPLAREEVVATFLSTEIGLRRGVVDERKAALLDALSSFDAYEGLYEVALTLAFSSEYDAAERLLERADELIAADGVPLPELKALRAIMLIQHAAPLAPWNEELVAKIDVDALRCDPVFPMHTALREDAGDGSLRGAADAEARKKAADRLKLAGKLLDDAERFGVSPLILHSARTCAAFYAGDMKEAASEAELTRKLLTQDTPAKVRDAIAANDAVMALGKTLLAEPPPVSSATKEAKAWGKKMGKGLKDKRYAASANALKTLRMLSSYPRPPAPEPPAKGASGASAQCKGAPAKGEHEAMSMPPTPEPAALGVCPAGWTALHTLPGAKQAAEAGTRLGVTTCAPAQQIVDGPRHRLILIDLPGSMSPALPALHIKVLHQDMTRPGAVSALAWSCGCNLMQRQGTSATGDEVALSVCPARGLPLGVVFQDAKGLLVRIAQVETEEQ
jgi:hypothetical protein